MNATAKVISLDDISAIKNAIIVEFNKAEKDEKEIRKRMPQLIERYVTLGRLINKAKKEVAHGQWDRWIQDNLPFSIRQSQKYVRVFKNRKKLIDAASNTNSEIRFSIDSLLKSLANKQQDQPSGIRFTGNVDYFTPPEIADCVRSLYDGQIDLDPASCEQANEVVGAKRIYTIEDDGLSKRWRGNIYTNPPYAAGKIPHFVEKLLNELDSGRVTQACVLLPSWTDTAAVQLAMKNSDAVLFFAGRVKFWRPDGKKGNPPNGQMLLYYGRRKTRFRKLFQEFGLIYN